MWCRAVWLESGQEVEDVVPYTWVQTNIVRWPPCVDATKSLESMAVPINSWRQFPLVKVKFKSDSREECANYDLTTTVEESSEEEDIPKRKQKKKSFPDYVTDENNQLGPTENKGEATQCSTPLNGDPHPQTEEINLPDPPQKISDVDRQQQASLSTDPSSETASDRQPAISNEQTRSRSHSRSIHVGRSRQTRSRSRRSGRRTRSRDRPGKSRESRSHSRGYDRCRRTRSRSRSAKSGRHRRRRSQSRRSDRHTRSRSHSRRSHRRSRHTRSRSNSISHSRPSRRRSRHTQSHSNSSRSRSNSRFRHGRSSSASSSTYRRSPSESPGQAAVCNRQSKASLSRKGRELRLEKATEELSQSLIGTYSSPLVTSTPIHGKATSSPWSSQRPSVSTVPSRTPSLSSQIRSPHSQRPLSISRNSSSTQSIPRNVTLSASSQMKAVPSSKRPSSVSRSTSSTPSISRSPSSQRTSTASISANVEMSRSISEQNDVFPITEARFQKRVLYLLVDIRKDLAELVKSKVDTGSNGDYTLSRAESLEELFELEEKCKDLEERKLMIQKLSLVGGLNMTDKIKKVLGRLMTNELMTSFNMKGNKGKMAFESTRLYQVIQASIMKTSSCTEHEIKETVARYLKYAPDRRGGGGRKATIQNPETCVVEDSNFDHDGQGEGTS